MTTHAALPRIPALPALSASPVSRATGADEALEVLYADHWRALVRLSVLLVRDQGTAEEVVQDAFVSVHGHWDRLRDHQAALAYLRRSVVNGSRSVLRHRAVRTRYAHREAVPGTAPDELGGTAERLAERAAVLDALAALPRRQREVLVLRHYLQLSEAEIAATLGISRGAVKSHASRGSAALRGLLAPFVEEDA